MEFNEWLVKEKNFSLKASHDAISRLRRVQKLLSTDKIPQDAVDKLEEVPEFKALSMCVKSQLRRTSKLYLEFSESN